MSRNLEMRKQRDRVESSEREGVEDDFGGFEDDIAPTYQDLKPEDDDYISL